MSKLNQRVVAITGAGSGIGQALAIECAKLGAAVAISDVNQNGLNDTQAKCEALGAKVFSQTVDVRDRKAVEQWAKDTHKTLGNAHVIINNAGVSLSACVDTMEYDDFEWIMDINFWGVVHGTKAFLPLVKQNDWGHIVNISSLFGLIAMPNQSAYNAAKFAVRGFTEALRLEMDLDSPHVGISCVHPGGIKTNIVNNGVIKDVVGTELSREESIDEFNNKLARTSAETAAKIIIKGIEKNRARVMVGADAKLAQQILRIIPMGYQRLVRLAMK